MQLQCLPFGVAKGFHIRASHFNVILFMVSKSTQTSVLGESLRNAPSRVSLHFSQSVSYRPRSNRAEGAWSIDPILHTASLLVLQQKPPRFCDNLHVNFSFRSRQILLTEKITSVISTNLDSIFNASNWAIYFCSSAGV